MSIILTRRAFVAGLLATGAGHAAVAQPAGAYPNRTIQMVVPYPPGGAVDLTARLIADKLRV